MNTAKSFIESALAKAVYTYNLPHVNGKANVHVHPFIYDFSKLPQAKLKTLIEYFETLLPELNNMENNNETPINENVKSIIADLQTQDPNKGYVILSFDKTTKEAKIFTQHLDLISVGQLLVVGMDSNYKNLVTALTPKPAEDNTETEKPNIDTLPSEVEAEKVL